MKVSAGAAAVGVALEWNLATVPSAAVTLSRAMNCRGAKAALLSPRGSIQP